MVDNFRPQGIYKPQLILQALKMERDYLKSAGYDGDTPTDKMQFYRIQDDKIVDKFLVPRKDFKNYKPENDVYYLDMVRDSGNDLVDYNLEPVQKLYDLWFSIKESKLQESLFRTDFDTFKRVCEAADLDIDFEEYNTLDKIEYKAGGLFTATFFSADDEIAITDNKTYNYLLENLVDLLRVSLGNYVGDCIDKNYLIDYMKEENVCIKEVIDFINRYSTSEVYHFEFITEVTLDDVTYEVIKLLDY